MALPLLSTANAHGASLPACLCGGTRYRHVHGPWRFMRSGALFAVVACRACGLARTAPPPYDDELEADIYQQLPYETVMEREPEWRGFFAPLLAAARRHRPSGRLLDVGCGTGLLVKMAGEAGYDAWGVEISARLSRHAREVLGLNVIHSDLAGAGFPDGHFDVVVLSHVLEHLTDPEHVFRDIRRVLAPGGVAIVEVPNMAGLQVPLMREMWSGWMPNMHVWQFTPKTLEATLRRLRLEPLELRCRDNIHVGTPLHPLKRLVRQTLFRAVERCASVLNRSDKILAVSRSPNA
jgi:SAM-dependent methyltransferase